VNLKKEPDGAGKPPCDFNVEVVPQECLPKAEGGHEGPMARLIVRNKPLRMSLEDEQ